MKATTTWPAHSQTLCQKRLDPNWERPLLPSLFVAAMMGGRRRMMYRGIQLLHRNCHGEVQDQGGAYGCRRRIGEPAERLYNENKNKKEVTTKYLEIVCRGV
jgi:hypothetical protein